MTALVVLSQLGDLGGSLPTKSDASQPSDTRVSHGEQKSEVEIYPGTSSERKTLADHL